jgi:EAL domain-containing protein (putative c-di-GMP-specific phosphodiesterase class I)
VQIAKGLGKTTTAEFVSDDATVAMLREFGVDYAQGFHIGRPEPVRVRATDGLN